MNDKIELIRLCGVLQSNFSCLSQSKLRTQPCHVRITGYHLCVAITLTCDNAVSKI